MMIRAMSTLRSVKAALHVVEAVASQLRFSKKERVVNLILQSGVALISSVTLQTKSAEHKGIWVIPVKVLDLVEKGYSVMMMIASVQQLYVRQVLQLT